MNKDYIVQATVCGCLQILYIRFQKLLNFLDFFLFVWYSLPGVTEQSAVQVETSKPVLQMASCNSCSDTSDEQKPNMYVYALNHS